MSRGDEKGVPARELACVFPFLSEAQAGCKLPPPGITLSTSTGSCGGLALGVGKGPRTGQCPWSGVCESEWAAGPWEAGRCATAGLAPASDPYFPVVSSL